MADEADRCGDLIDRETQASIERTRANVKNALKPIGACHFCTSALPSHLLFCDKDCRDDWQKLRDKIDRAGGLA